MKLDNDKSKNNKENSDKDNKNNKKSNDNIKDKDEKNKERLGGEIYECHGILGDKDWPRPLCVVKSDKPNRKDQGNMTTSSEYLDEPEVLDKKMEIIAQLIQTSKCCIAYCGAGLSRMAGIGDYASNADNSITNSVPKLKSAFDAKPTFSHHVLTKLERKGLLKYFIQQNHDGLPQKAGFPQEKICEIHGAWYDPSNPVVQFSEKLRGDLFNMMLEIEERTDLTLCLGTSLSGMNSDRCAHTPATKFCDSRIGNGTVMINLQQTGIDGMCSIRVWAKLDDAFKILAEKLSLNMNKLYYAPKLKEDVFLIPYDSKGHFLGKTTKKMMKINFKIGSQIKIVNEFSKFKGIVGEIVRKSDDHYTWKCSESKHCYALGFWMIESAVRGALDTFPYANKEVEFVDKKFEYIEEKNEEKSVFDLEDEILKQVLEMSMNNS